MPIINTFTSTTNSIPNVTLTEEDRRSGWAVARRAIFDNSSSTPPTKTTQSKLTEDAIAITTQEYDVAPPIVVQVRYDPTNLLWHKPVDQSTEEKDEETLDDEESTEEVPFHTSDNYTKRSLYERLITSKTEVTSLTDVFKEMRREAKKDAAENGVLLRKIESYKSST